MLFASFWFLVGPTCIFEKQNKSGNLQNQSKCQIEIWAQFRFEENFILRNEISPPANVVFRVSSGRAKSIQSDRSPTESPKLSRRCRKSPTEANVSKSYRGLSNLANLVLPYIDLQHRLDLCGEIYAKLSKSEIFQLKICMQVQFVVLKSLVNKKNAVIDHSGRFY